MAMTTNLLATSKAVKLHGVRFFSSFLSRPNHFLACRLPQSITRRVQTSCCYRETSYKSPEPEPSSVSDGVGIIRFLKGKTYLITGATGFLGKVLIEKLLRASLGIGKIFILIKSKDQESANKRLYDEVLFPVSSLLFLFSFLFSFHQIKIVSIKKIVSICSTQIISSDLFSHLKQMHGRSYEEFMKSKLIPIIGEIGEENLGIGSEVAANISGEIDVVISCAGRTTFDDRYDLAINVNALGPGRLLSFAKDCKKLKLFLHISTAYVTGKKEGTVLETPLCIGKNITSDLNIEHELKLASEAVRKLHGSGEIKKLKELGIQRAQHYGWENTYTFTKAMGETLIQTMREDAPVVIIRPSIIESSYKEPFPGWLQGIRMSDPIILAYGKGQISGLWGDSQSFADIIPVDMVVNATIAAMAKHARTYEPYTFFQARFDDTNTRSLIQEMSMEERKIFEFDIKSIDWEHYIVNVHLPGLKREICKENSS
ncbi:unnamed protein product [Brassica rapa]|uniref:Fatty acyl-CoA reductase n=1 Tax=Brassica campestris TaxID=3711 RepID=A0A8D9HSD1_BRACM|nr:unnamed protein product [Brassica rapa]